jgi:Do/DeqQ family serine protease
MKKIFGFILVGLFSAIFSVALFKYTGLSGKDTTKVIIQENTPAQLSRYSAAASGLAADGFVNAANISTPAVVHITTASTVKTASRGNSIWDFFGEEFQYDNGPQIGSGSGVIISEEGYIVTNHHVVEDADEIKVVLDDKREYTAKLVGSDPSTDLAVIKIDSKNAALAHLTFANSDDVQVGEWVLAVGNPFNLASTVTAGIVSAKARNINILREKAGNIAIESFIQTDAAVNPGNSGGALVDLNGNLVGINTAIATPTGTYAGYSFAVPANLVKKVVNDIVNYGVVQRGFMGVSIASLTSEQADELGIKDVQGVYVSEIVSGSGADDAGLEPGDVITKINNVRVKSSSELQELVARHSPGDKLNVELLRKNKTLAMDVLLKGRDNTTKLISKEEAVEKSTSIGLLGGVFEDLSNDEAKALGVKGGVKVNKIKDGYLSKYTQMKPGFVITKVNNTPVRTVAELEKLLNGFTGDGVLIEGRYPGEREIRYYAFGM